MKFTCYKTDLAEALNFAARAIAAKPSTPVLGGFFLKTVGSLLEIQANNFTTGISVKIPVKVDEPGEVLVSGKSFREFVSALGSDLLSCRLEEGELVIDAGNSQLRLFTMPPADFPTVKELEGATEFAIRANRLRNLLKRTLFAAAKDDSYPIFTGVHFAIADCRLSVTATNKHRIAIAREIFLSAVPDTEFTLPAETLAALLARIPDTDDLSIEFHVTDKSVGFVFDNVFMTARLIAGEFPPGERVIPKSSATQITVSTKNFLSALSFIKLMSKETEFNTVRLVIGDNAIEVSASSNAVGDATQKILAAISDNIDNDHEVFGDESDNLSLDISFNVDYLIDVLKVIATDKVNVGFNDRYRPAVFTEPNYDKYVYVATPVRV